MVFFIPRRMVERLGAPQSRTRTALRFLNSPVPLVWRGRLISFQQLQRSLMECHTMTWGRLGFLFRVMLAILGPKLRRQAGRTIRFLWSRPYPGLTRTGSIRSTTALMKLERKQNGPGPA